VEQGREKVERVKMAEVKERERKNNDGASVASMEYDQAPPLPEWNPRNLSSMPSVQPNSNQQQLQPVVYNSFIRSQLNATLAEFKMLSESKQNPFKFGGEQEATAKSIVLNYEELCGRFEQLSGQKTDDRTRDEYIKEYEELPSVIDQEKLKVIAMETKLKYGGELYKVYKRLKEMDPKLIRKDLVAKERKKAKSQNRKRKTQYVSGGVVVDITDFSVSSRPPQKRNRIGIEEEKEVGFYNPQK
jgi:hypothetical protein